MNDFKISGYAARICDYLVRAPEEEVGKTWLAKLTDKTLGVTVRKNFQHFHARIASSIIFPFLLTIDLGMHLLKLAGSKVRAVVVMEKSSPQVAEQAEEVKRCALGIIASPLGLIYPDIVTRHFVPKPHHPGIIEAGGKLHRALGKELQPTGVLELIALIQQAKADGKKVTLSGSHLSQSKDTLPSLPDNMCINMQKMNKVTIDPLTKTAKVQAGATWSDVQAHANKHGLAVKVMQASNVFSIGGSISVNCHGWDHQTGTVSNSLRSITIIDANGEDLQILKPGDELFGLVVGGHGLFGLIVEAEIDLIQNETLVSWGKKITPADYVQYFEKEILPKPEHRMHLYRLSLDPRNLLKDGVAVTYSTTSTKFPRSGLGVSLLAPDEPEKGARFDRIMLHLARKMPILRAIYWSKESEKIVQDERMSRNEIMRPPIKAAFNNSRADAEWLQEYFVKGKDLSHFLDKLGRVLTENEVSLLNATVRYVKKDTHSKLPYARDEDHYAIVLFFNQSLAPENVTKTHIWVQEIIDYLIKCGGNYYLPYQHFATKEQFEKCYPTHTQVKELKEKYDKDHLFDNGLYTDYLK